MIAAESIKIADLPSLPISERKKLPNIAACYLVLENERAIYVGQSTNLTIRWLNHHKLKQIKSRGANIKIAWIEVSDPKLLLAIEKALIQYFKPILNKQKKEIEKFKKLIKAQKAAPIDRSRDSAGRFLSADSEALVCLVSFKLPITLMEKLRLASGLHPGSWLREAVKEKLSRERDSKSKATDHK